MAQLFITNPYFRGIVINIWENDVISLGNGVIPRRQYHSFVFLTLNLTWTFYTFLRDHSVNVSQSHRRNSEKLKTRPHIRPYSVQRFLVSCFRVQLTADASFSLQINYLDRIINMCAVTVQTMYANSTVKYRSNTDFNFRYWLSAVCVLKSARHLC